MSSRRPLFACLPLLLSCGFALAAQPIRNWSAPPTWTPPRTNLAAQLQSEISDPLSFISVNPCRVVDTRNASGTFGGPIFSVAEARTYALSTNPACTGFPAASTIQGYSVNITVTQTAGTGFVSAYPSGTAPPLVSTANFVGAGQSVSNAAVIPAGSGGNAGKIDVYASQQTHVIIDVNGYYGGGFASRRVIDAQQQVIGDLVVNPGSTAAIRFVSGVPFLLPVGRSGFLGSPQFVFHTTADCSGTRYFQVDPTVLLRSGGIVGGKLLFASDPIQSITAHSAEAFQPNDDPSLAGPCSAAGGLFPNVGVLAIVDLTNFVGPFAIQ